MLCANGDSGREPRFFWTPSAVIPPTTASVVAASLMTNYEGVQPTSRVLQQPTHHQLGGLCLPPFLSMSSQQQQLQTPILTSLYPSHTTVGGFPISAVPIQTPTAASTNLPHRLVADGQEVEYPMHIAALSQAAIEEWRRQVEILRHVTPSSGADIVSSFQRSFVDPIAAMAAGRDGSEPESKDNNTVNVQQNGSLSPVKRKTAAAVASRTTSFTIADILGERTTENSVSSSKMTSRDVDSSNADIPSKMKCRSTDNVSEMVRPWASSVLCRRFDRSRSDDSVSEWSSSAHSMPSPETTTANDDGQPEVAADADDEDIEVDVDDPECLLTSSIGRRQSMAQMMSSSDSVSEAESTAVCPLGALLRMASQTNFDKSPPGSGLDDCLATSEDYASDGSGMALDAADRRRHSLSRRHLFASSLTSSVIGAVDAKCFRSCRKRRKTRTAFTNQQISELERWFGRQKYLTPADRDEIAAALRLSAAQVITWFQNRRAKLKRDLEELKADVAAAKALGTEPSTAVLDRLAELTRASGLHQHQQSSGPGGVVGVDRTDSDCFGFMGVASC